jgi:hypothetical protein
MDSHDRLASLLVRWQEAYRQGRDVPAHELCRDCPELAEALQHHIDFHKQLVGVPGSGGDFANRPTATSPPDAALDTASLDELPPPLPALLTRPAGETPVLFRRYRILKLLGEGGMGVVLLAEDAVAGRQVALKFMKPGGGSARKRFLREARAAASLRDDHVVPIFHVDEVEGTPYLVMPFLDGESLEARLERAGKEPLPMDEVVQIGREAALGLEAAHAKGLIHRDVKPANLWLERRLARSDSLRTLVLDFGLARPLEGQPLTEAGGVLGTPGYLAPEQADGRAVDHRADLFSLGCVLYRMATGRPAFEGKTVTALLRAVAEHDPPPARQINPHVPPALSDLIGRMLAKDPAGRPASAREVADVLKQLSQVEPATRPTAPLPAAVKPGKEGARWRWMAAAAALLLVLGGVTVWALNQPGRGADNPEPGPSRSPPVPRVQKDWVDIRIWRPGPGGARKLRLREPGALPLYKGDQYRIVAKVAVPAYVYLFWIDTDGDAHPVYPWKTGEWGTRPARENPITVLDLPPDMGVGFEIDEEAKGMETLLLLARETPLTMSDAELQKRLAGLPRQDQQQNPDSAVWFRNWTEVTDDDDRRTKSFSTGRINDPVLQLQGKLREQLGDVAPFSSAVSFARLGKRE